MIQLSKKESESAFDFHKRIIEGKLRNKTLADNDYSELALLAYGKPYSSDVARRMFYGSQATLDIINSELDKIVKESRNGDSILREINNQRIELQKDRQKFYDQRREFNKLVSLDGRKDHLYEYIAKAAEGLNEKVNYMFENKCDCEPEYQDNDAVLVLSDWHYGMVTDNIFNKYNTDICVKRVISVVEEAKKRILLHRCKNLHIIVLGDLFHGAIHTSARVASEELVCDQIMQVSEILAQTVMELHKYVDNTYLYMTYGNHARTVQDKHDSIHSDNMEKIIPWWLEQRLKDFNNINIVRNFDTEFLLVDVLGHTICAAHGDLDSVKTSPRLLNTLFQKQYGKDIEYILLGDKHHRESFEELYITSVICGSLCGTDDYANEKRLYSSPSQMLLIVNKKCGVDAEYTIKC